MDKLKDVVNPSKHTQTTGEGDAYRSRPQEGVQQTQRESTMPNDTGLRHQGQDTTGGVTDALKPGTSAGGHSTSGQAVREMTDAMGSTANRPSKKLEGGLGSDPGSAAQGRF